MKDSDKKTSDAWARMSRGFRRKFQRDVKFAAVGVTLGVALGALAAYFMGLPLFSGAKLGGLNGLLVALLAGGLMPLRFDNDQNPSERDP